MAKTSMMAAWRPMPTCGVDLEIWNSIPDNDKCLHDNALAYDKRYSLC